VFSHAFNDHKNCRLYFNCPCAPDKNKKIWRTISSYKDNEWLDAAGGVAGGAKLKPLLEAVWAKITTPQHMNALCHPYNTQVSSPPLPTLGRLNAVPIPGKPITLSSQVCEAINGLHTSMHPKRRDLSKGLGGRAIHYFTAARFNDGVLSAVSGVLKGLDIEIDSVARNILEKQDNMRLTAKDLKASIYGKGKRKKAKQQRKLRDAKEAGQTGRDYVPCGGLGDVPLGAEGGVHEGVVVGKKQRAAGRCSLCQKAGHTKRRCPGLVGPSGPVAEEIVAVRVILEAAEGEEDEYEEEGEEEQGE